MQVINNDSNHKKTLESLAIDNLDDKCYISNIDTYDLLFMNKKLKNILGFNDESYRGQKCYKVLQNKTSPCSFCTNIHLKENKYYTWEYYNEHINKYYELKDTLILHNNQKLRLEIASDITPQTLKYTNLTSQVTVEQTLVQCASTLCKTDDLSLAIDEILSVVGTYYKADRAYLFEIDETEQYVNNTYEWCDDGIEPQLEALQKIPISVISNWIEKFLTVGEFSIDSLADALSVNSAEYKILEMQGIQSLVASPLMNKDKVVGFIGLDNPTINKNNASMLKTIAMFILDDLHKMKVAKHLEFLSNRDKLTGLYNRNYYDQMLKKTKQSKSENIGVIYIDINGLKTINDKYGHDFGDIYITKCVKVLKDCFGDRVFRIGGDEFIVIFDDIDYKEFDRKKVRFQELLNENTEVSMAFGSSWCSDISEIDKHIRNADVLMLKNKRNHYKNMDICIKNLHDNANDMLSEEISDKNFEILLQPKIYLDSGKIAGTEAFVRKKDGQGNYISPNSFIPQYESQGVIHLIDLFVLRQVCEFLWEAKNSDMTNLPHISLNFSRLTLLADNIHMECQKICNEFNIDPEMITIEVSEDCGFVEYSAIGQSVEEFQKMGFKLSLDHFGCKYSNIEIISNISFDEVKFDKSLLQKTDSNKSKHIILDHLIKMYQSFSNMTIVIEGIDSQYQLDLLNSNRNLIGQGLFFSKPLTRKTFWEYYMKMEKSTK